MAEYCVMVKGPCRGKKCDFWARIRIQKRTLKALIKEARESIHECQDLDHDSKRVAMDGFWYQLGIRDMDRLCEEEPSLCEKIRRVERAVLPI
ncbi:hypothetical protein EU537_00150 [Candidatus Thorarchaeota archaeon]|nr:MAG: hypothetical protein EU537_00150 [Candidatus Thorarchaeota archaeon]